MNQIQKLNKYDYYNGFLELLSQLTVVEIEKITYDDFCKRLDELTSEVFVISNMYCRVIATGSIFIENKFIHKLGKVGHIEDVVVREGLRNFGYGSRMIQHLINYAKEKGCYKVILDCSFDNLEFYKKMGFEHKDAHMALYL